MRLFNQFLTVTLLSAIGLTPAFAGVLLDFTPITGWDSAQAAQLPPLEAGWSAYLMSARSDDNSLISAVDVQLRGNFAQRWGFDETDLLGVATPTGSSRTGFDSHLLPMNEALLISSTVHEDLGASPLTMPSGARVGNGSLLRGVWGIPGNVQRSALDLAYVVIPSGSLDQLDYAVDVATRESVFNLRKGFEAPVYTPPLPPPTVVQEGTSTMPPGYHLPGMIPDSMISPPHEPAPPTLPPVNSAPTTQLNLTRLDTLNPATQPLSITQPGWAGYLLSATSLDGAKFSAVDVKLQGNFHQYWGFNEDAGEALATVQGVSRAGVDTHLLPAANAIPITSQFAEDLGPERTATAGGSLYGVGNSIQGVWGIPGASQAETLDLAYIVAPEGFSLDQLKYSIDLARTEGEVVNLRNGFAMPVPPVIVPDPHTVTGELQRRTPGTTNIIVTKEDGSRVLVEVPIPGWQPGDVDSSNPVAWVPNDPDPIDEIIDPVFISNPTIDPMVIDDAITTIDRTGYEHIECCGLLWATTKHGRDSTIVLYDGDAANELDAGRTRDEQTWMYFVADAGLGDFVGTSAALSNFRTLGSSGFDQPVPEPSAIVITLAGIALLVRRRRLD